MLTYSDRSASLRPVVELNRWYCHRHGYDLVMRSAPTHPALHPSWQKIQLVLDYAPRVLGSGRAHHESVALGRQAGLAVAALWLTLFSAL